MKNKERKLTSKKLNKKQKLTLKQKLFCKYYLEGYHKKNKDDTVESFNLGNGVRSVSLSYKYNLKTQYELCANVASENLNKLYIKEYMRNYLEEHGWNDNVMDARLLDITTNGNDNDSINAIKEYNKLKKRITEKVELTGKDGKELNESVSEKELDRKIEKAIAKLKK